MSDGSILPVVRYANPAEAADWLCDAYGFSIHHVAERPDGGTAYIVLRFGENSVVVAPHGSSAFDDLMVQPADVGNRSTQTCYLTVEDVDQHCARALIAGARIEVEPGDDGIGGRFYMSRDPEGHLWSFGDALAGLAPAGPVGHSEPPRRYPLLSGRAAVGVGVFVGVAVGCGAMLYLSSSGQLEQGARASATKRLLASEAAVPDPAGKLQISQFELAEAQQLKRNAEKWLNASEADYQNRLKDSQGALDAAVRAKELASQALEAERRRAQEIQTQLDEASQQLARLRADGSKAEVEAREPRDTTVQPGDALPGSRPSVETEHAQLTTAPSTEQELRERLRASERESRELELRARAAIQEMDKEDARARAAQAAEAAEAAKKAEAEHQRQAAEAVAAARKAEEERQRAAAEAAQKADAERQRQAAEAAAAARKAEEERQRAAAEAAQKAEAERQRQAAEAAAAARKIEEERQLAAARAEAAQKAEAERIAKEAAETKARADQEKRRRTLGITVSPEDGARFLARGRSLLSIGDIASARLFLERASNAGLADAAMELAETYDPETVKRLIAVGLVGDREQARAWYRRAQALGSSAAAERLKSIAGQ